MRILIVDDDLALGELLESHCRSRGHAVDRVTQASRCLEVAEASVPDCVFLDVRLGDGDGLELLPELKMRCQGIQVAVMTGYEPLHNISRASARGADHFLRKPFGLSQLDGVLEDLEAQGSGRQADRGDPEAPEPGESVAFVGTSEAMIRVCQSVGLSARSGVTTLIEGESGVGKELAARAIHSLRGSERPFIAVDCASIVETLFESELFGHEKGAFTGAYAAREGKARQADGGILFLDEIAELTPRMQAKLLRFLQSRVFEPVGGSEAARVDFQLVAATNRNLQAMVDEESFRSDLYHRLDVLRIQIPPLRERREDIRPLVRHFLSEIPSRIRMSRPSLTPGALEALVAHAWPGNVRELENTVTRLVLEARGRRVDRAAVLALQGAPAEPASREAPGTLAEVERAAIVRALAETDWKMGAACALLGISRPTLRRKIAQYGLSH